MKRCPECRKDYLDDSLLYCLDDGAALFQGSVTDDEPATAILSADAISGDDLTRSLGSQETTIRQAHSPSAGRRLLSHWSLPWIAAGVLALVAAYGWAGSYLSGNKSNLEAVRLSFEPPGELSFNDIQPDAAVISPDGTKVAFSAAANGKNMLYVRELNSADAKILPGSDDPIEPFWSPDSRSVAYGSAGKLKRSDLNGGNAQILCDAARIVGGSWSRDGTIIFTPDYRQSLVQVSAQGGEPQPIVMNFEPGEPGRHRYPYFLPDGRRFVFYRELKGVWAGSLDSPETVQIVPDNSPVVYSKSGWLIFIRNEALVAQAFDPDKLALSGEVKPVISGQKSWINFFRFSASDTGSLLWQGVWERDYQLVWFDREGKKVGEVETPAKISVGVDPNLSPDGKRVAIKRNPPNTIWVVDLEKGTSIRITSDFGQMPIWSPDGTRIAYSGGPGLSVKAASGLGEAETVLAASATFPKSWSPDGKFIVYLRRGTKTRLDMYTVSLDGERRESLLLNSPFDESSPSISPDGKWLAYTADDTGENEVYVQSFSSEGNLGADRKRISTTGGRMPIWRRDGSELFFISGDGEMMSTAVKASSGGFEFEAPRALFKTNMLSHFGSVHEFDVAPAGRKFLIGTLIGESKAPPPTVILNWTALLGK